MKFKIKALTEQSLMEPAVHYISNITLLIVFVLLSPLTTLAQLERERVVSEDPMLYDFIFPSTLSIGTGTVHTLRARHLNSSVLHSFGLIEGGIDRFFGLDDGANTRLGLEYGVNDRLTATLGRMTFNKVVDAGGTYKLMRQDAPIFLPLEVAAKVNMGIDTRSGRSFEFSDRLSYLVSIMIAHRLENLSLQLSPVAAHFNHVSVEEQNRLYGLGISANYVLSDRFSAGAEYLAVLSNRNPGTNDAMGVVLNILTGGHVFQLFFTSTQWHNEQFIMARNRDRFWDGEIRFGFNINRLFTL